MGGVRDDRGLGIAVRPRGDVLVVTLVGRLDIYTVPAFRERVDPAAWGLARVVVDLSTVTLIDSSGLGALVRLGDRVGRETGGQVVLVCPRRRLRRVFEVTGIRRAFAFEDGVAAALEALDAAGPSAAVAAGV